MDPESGPLAIYYTNGGNRLPITVGVLADQAGKGFLMTVMPHIDLRNKPGLSLHGRSTQGTWYSSVVALGCIRGLWDHWVNAVYKDKSDSEKDDAKKRAFSSRIILDIQTAGDAVYGTSLAAGMVLSLVSMIFGVKFRQDTVITGELSPSGFIWNIGSPGDKADVVAKGGKERLVLPVQAKELVEKERGERKSSADGESRVGDNVVLIGIVDIWRALSETIDMDPPGECTCGR